jgi:hypothetical protein
MILALTLLFYVRPRRLAACSPATCGGWRTDLRRDPMWRGCTRDE